MRIRTLAGLLHDLCSLLLGFEKCLDILCLLSGLSYVRQASFQPAKAARKGQWEQTMVLECKGEFRLRCL